MTVAVASRDISRARPRFTIFIVAAPTEEKERLEINTGQAATLLEVSVSTIYRYVDSGDLVPARDILPRKKRRGRKKHSYRFQRADVLALKAKQQRR